MGYVTKVVRKPDGQEQLIDESETIYPLEVTPEEQEPQVVEEQKDPRGVVIRRVVRRPVMVTSKRTVIRKVERRPDGQEKEIEKKVEEAPSSEDEPSKTRQLVVRKIVKEPTGEEKVIEQPEYVSPLEGSTTEESETEVDQKRVRGTIVRTVNRRSVQTSQKRVVRRIVQHADGRQEGPVEDTIEEPVEPTKFTVVRRTVVKPDGRTETVEEPHYEMPKDETPAVEEEKDRRGVVVRRIVRRPVPVITRRKVYRKVIYAPDGTEKGVEEKVEEPQQPTFSDRSEEIIAPMDIGQVETMPEVILDTRPPDESDVTVVDGKVIRKTVTVRKRIVRKIIVLPDGSRKEVEEEVDDESPEEPREEEITRREVHRRIFTSQEKPQEQPKPVERMYVTKVVRQPDGQEQLIDESETIYPLEVTPEEQEPQVVEEQKDPRGVVIRRVVRRPVMVTSKRTVIRKVERRPDGQEKEIEKKVE